MNEIQWLDFNQVLKICHRQIKWDGLRDQGLLESALNRPFNLLG